MIAKGGDTMSSRRKKFTPRFILFVLLLIGAAFLYVFMGADSANNNEEAARLEEMSAQQENDNAEMQRKIEFAATDEYAEQEARDRFGYAKEGETAYVVADD